MEAETLGQWNLFKQAFKVGWEQLFHRLPPSLIMPSNKGFRIMYMGKGSCKEAYMHTRCHMQSTWRTLIYPQHIDPWHVIMLHLSISLSLYFICTHRHRSWYIWCLMCQVMGVSWVYRCHLLHYTCFSFPSLAKADTWMCTRASDRLLCLLFLTFVVTSLSLSPTHVRMLARSLARTHACARTQHGIDNAWIGAPHQACTRCYARHRW